MPTEISSYLHFRTLLNGHAYLLVDFHATWCGPCHTIAPVYEQFDKAHGVSGKFAFVKVNVDAQQQIAQEYGVNAMPTFILFENGEVKDSVRGADVRGLKRLIDTAVKGLREQELKATQAQAEAKAKVVQEEKAGDGEEKTVSGSYGMTGGSHWKMSLS